MSGFGKLTAIVLAVLAMDALGVQPEIVEFRTSDGVTIVGDYYRPASKDSPVAILLPMHRSQRAAYKPLVPRLTEAGFAVLAIDLRGHGDSLSPKSARMEERSVARDATLYNAMHLDVEAAYAFLAGQPNVDLSRLATVGASVGCSVAFDYARRDRSVDVVVALTPGTNYLGVNSREHVADLGAGRSVLLLATEDERVACDELSGLNSIVEMDIVAKGRIHGTRMFGAVEGIEKRIARFMQEHVGDGQGGHIVGSLDGSVYFSRNSKEHVDIPPERRRLFSSVEEARSRGLIGADSVVEGAIYDGNIPRQNPKPMLVPDLLPPKKSPK